MRAQQYARYHTKSLETNWGVIKALLGKLCTCYETIKDLDESGTAKDDNILDALDLYKQKANKNGVFKHCWLRLCTYMRPFNSMLKWSTISDGLPAPHPAENDDGVPSPVRPQDLYMNKTKSKAYRHKDKVKERAKCYGKREGYDRFFHGNDTPRPNI